MPVFVKPGDIITLSNKPFHCHTLNVHKLSSYSRILSQPPSRHSLDPFRWSDNFEDHASRHNSQHDHVVAGVLSRLFTGVWQQHYAELNVDQKTLCLYKDADKEEEVISYNFDLERTEMMLPQVSASKANGTTND